MYDNGNVVSDIEDLLMDFLEYRRTKKSQNYIVQNYNEPGKGWPSYKDVDTRNFELYEDDYMNPIKAPLDTKTEYPDDMADRDIDHMKSLYCDIAKKLHPYVDQILMEYEHDDSPIYDDYMSKETLCKIVDRVLERACMELAELKGIKGMAVDTDYSRWDDHKLLRGLTDGIVLNEVYWRRRPGRRHRRRFHDHYDHHEHYERPFHHRFPYPTPRPYPYI